MIETPGILWTLFSFLLVIGPLIFVHELGHYLAGRAFGVHADAFSIGFGREILGWTDRRGTRWKVGWMPMGGYVKFAGDMNPASVASPEWRLLPAEQRRRMFQAKPVWQRFLIVFAGPATNFLVAIAIFIAFFMAFGVPRTPTTINTVAPASAAAEAGLRPGDRVLKVGGREVDRFEDIAAIVQLRPGERMQIELIRDGRALSIPATPKVDVLRDRFGNEFRRGLLGISPGTPVMEPVGAGQVIGEAIDHTFGIVTTMVDAIGQIITGRRSVRELAGPVGMAKFAGQQATLGWLPFIEFMALISINLGFINLLPIPLLDGGHLLFYAVEAVRRKPLPAAAQDWAFRSGLALLLSFMIFVTLNDLVSIGLWERLAGLIG